MKKFIKKLFGIDKIEAELVQAVEAEEQRLKEEEKRIKEEERKLQEEEMELLKKKDPKAYATKKKEPWVAVLDTHVNKDNVRNGFFELDWNEYFVLQLRSNGYTGNTDEEVVDIWFQELCRNVGSEEGVDMERRGSGFINVNNIGDGKSEVY